MHLPARSVAAQISFTDLLRASSVALLLLAVTTSTALGQVDPHDQRNFSLKNVAKWIRTVDKKAAEKAHDGNSTKLESAQLTNIYQILNDLQRRRGEYIESLHLLIDAREQHLPQATAVVRSRAVGNNARELYEELQKLDAAVAPVQFSLDVKHPEMIHYKRYQQRQEQAVKQMKMPDMVGSFTTKELKAIEKDANHNGENLKQAIEEMAATLKALNSSGGL